MRELRREFTFDTDAPEEVYNFIVDFKESHPHLFEREEGNPKYICKLSEAVDPLSIALTVSIWDAERLDDRLVRNRYVAEIECAQEEMGKCQGRLYIETDPERWHQPEDAPWRHQEGREEPWPVPMHMGTRFVLSLWHSLVNEWTERQGASQQHVVGSDRPSQADEDRSAGGAPRKADYDWAYKETEKGRGQNEVYKEWLRIPKVRERDLADPWDSFKQAMRYRRKQEKRE